MTYIIESQTPRRFIAFGLLLSVVLHSLLLTFLTSPFKLKDPPIIAVDVVFEPSPPELSHATNQIVSPPEQATESETPPETRYLSDKNLSVAKEQIKIGDAPNAGPVMGKSAPQKPQAKAASNQMAKLQPKEDSPTLKELSLDQGTLLKKFGEKTSKKSPTLDDELQNLSAAEPFSRAAGSGAAILGVSGTRDFLPNLPDGDITMLNTKAHRYAVFVRRVATQVFSQLRSVGWESLHASDIQAIDQSSVVRAVLSRKGDLLKVTLERDSGSGRFDQVLERAVEKGARDPNPPAEAALRDGNIHFIFEARSWTRLAADPRTGAPMERRWLVLGTGLE